MMDERVKDNSFNHRKTIRTIKTKKDSKSFQILGCHAGSESAEMLVVIEMEETLPKWKLKAAINELRIGNTLVTYLESWYPGHGWTVQRNMEETFIRSNLSQILSG